jgi:hypothetical protein
VDSSVLESEAPGIGFEIRGDELTDQSVTLLVGVGIDLEEQALAALGVLAKCGREIQILDSAGVECAAKG